MKYLILAGLFVLGASCSSGDKPPVFDSETAGTSGSQAGASGSHAGTTGKAGAGGGGTEAGEAGQGGDGGTVSPVAPLLSITNPVSATDANTGTVVLGDQITVLCTAKASSVSGAQPVNPSSIKLAMLDATSTVLKSSSGTPTTNPNEYSAPFVLTALPNGPVKFQCTADDTATPVNHASVTVDTLVDRGPTITPTQPAKDSAHNLLGPVDFEFTVAAAPITKTDTHAEVSGVTLNVSGVAITATNKGSGAYQATVDFNDKKLFPSPPNGTIPVVIAATNSRTAPGKATATLTYTFVLDGVGPVVSFTSPPEGAVVGRASVLSFSVQDAGSGVDNSTLSITLADGPHLFSTTNGLWTADASGNYTFKIGTQLASDSDDSQVTADVNVSDKASNPSTGNSRVFKLDTQPPTVDMDPPKMSLTRAGTAPGTLQCSDAFDPIGSFAPNDLSTVTNFGYFRALVWDQTNRKAGQTIFTYALTDKSSVRMYIQPDPTKPLMHDETGPNGVPDGICDEIWTGSPPEQKSPADLPLPFVALTAVSATGAASWGTAPPTDPICQAGPTSTQALLCAGHSDMTLVIHHPVPVIPPEPVVYAFQPVADPTSAQCSGDQWQISTVVKTVGWVCAAVRAVDNVGNPGISAPLRLCLANEANPNPCNNVPPPSCTDSCTPPTHFQVTAATQQ